MSGPRHAFESPVAEPRWQPHQRRRPGDACSPRRGERVAISLSCFADDGGAAHLRHGPRRSGRKRSRTVRRCSRKSARLHRSPRRRRGGVHGAIVLASSLRRPQRATARYEVSQPLSTGPNPPSRCFAQREPLVFILIARDCRGIRAGTPSTSGSPGYLVPSSEPSRYELRARGIGSERSCRWMSQKASLRNAGFPDASIADLVRKVEIGSGCYRAVWTSGKRAR